MPENRPLPAWAAEMIALYESGSVSQFLIHGNVEDHLLLPVDGGERLGDLRDFLLEVMLPSFEVVLTYDLGNGIRVERGGERFSEWPALREQPELPKGPRPAIETLTRYFRYCANLARLGRPPLRVACLVHAAHLVAPALPGVLQYDLNALALLMRDWASDESLRAHPLVTCLFAENLNDLHPLIVNNPRTGAIKVPLPSPEELGRAFERLATRYPKALSAFGAALPALGERLAGVTMHAAEGLLRVKEHRAEPLRAEDVSRLKKELVERDCAGLIDFIESRRTLDDFQGGDAVKAWLRQDLALWRQDDLAALPMGYLFCGPVGTGKTFLVECLAGEAGVPVVRIKNFRDKWVGSTEGNLEKIFRLLSALGRCYVFVDEADQALGRRDAGTSDSGLSGRIYAMIAQEMSRTENRGKLVWILATSRPDLIEVDLKRPGRVDVKIPLFPTATPAEGFALIRALCRRRGLAIGDDAFAAVAGRIPELLTPGAAEALAVKVYRTARTEQKTAEEALALCLADYQNPIPRAVLERQIALAIVEASDRDFVPAAFAGLV